MHIRPFYFDPKYLTPLNVATKDTDEAVVDAILQHDFLDTKWLVRDPPSESWERYDNLKNVGISSILRNEQVGSIHSEDRPNKFSVLSAEYV